MLPDFFHYCHLSFEHGVHFLLNREEIRRGFFYAYNFKGKSAAAHCLKDLINVCEGTFIEGLDDFEVGHVLVAHFIGKNLICLLVCNRLFI